MGTRKNAHLLTTNAVLTEIANGLSKVGQRQLAQRTVHVPPTLRGILHAEALAADQSMSALVREWFEERLDLLVGEQAA